MAPGAMRAKLMKPLPPWSSRLAAKSDGRNACTFAGIMSKASGMTPTTV